MRAALSALRDVTRPTLVVFDDADELEISLEGLAGALATVPVLALLCGRDAEALAGAGALETRRLGPLDAAGVREFAAAFDAPAEWLLETGEGVPRRLHALVSRRARRAAAHRVEAAAGRTAAGRAELRTVEAELAGGVLELQRSQEDAGWGGADGGPVRCPFKGLASFDVADAPFFFGRERLVAELVARLVGASLLGVVGPSGSGKSSVVRAGLLPALSDGVLPGSADWVQAVIRPGEHPLRELADATAGLDRRRVLLVVDQFEETFTVCHDDAERSAFVTELVAAGRRDRIAVLAIRADHYGRCAAYRELSALLAAHHVLVGAMRRDELRRAVERPALRAGLRVEPELTDALVADVADEPGALPMLSTALLELWQRRDGRSLRLSTYQDTGGVRAAVARQAEEAFARLDGGQQRLARSVLLRLAAEGLGGAIERRRIALGELDDAAEVVAALTDQRLLTISAGTVELAHEALLREWPRLRMAGGGRRGTAAAPAPGRRGARVGRARAQPGRLTGALAWRPAGMARPPRARPQPGPSARIWARRSDGQSPRGAGTGGGEPSRSGLRCWSPHRGHLVGRRTAQRSARPPPSAARMPREWLATRAQAHLPGRRRARRGCLGSRPTDSQPTVEAAQRSTRRCCRLWAPTAGSVAAGARHRAAERGDQPRWTDAGRRRRRRDGPRCGTWPARRRLGPPLRGRARAVTDVAFSPDGALLASGSDDATVRLWDVASAGRSAARSSNVPLP